MMCCSGSKTILVGDKGCKGCWWLVSVIPVAVRDLQRGGWFSHVRVLGVAVATQVHLALEGLIAKPARERLVTSVLAHMCDQIRALTERLWAHYTLVRLLTCMYVGMLLHVGLLVEPLAAVLAGVGPRVRVDQEVSGQRARPLEALPALLALERFFISVFIFEE